MEEVLKSWFESDIFVALPLLKPSIKTELLSSTWSSGKESTLPTSRLGVQSPLEAL